MKIGIDKLAFATTPYYLAMEDLAQGRNHLTDITPEMLPTQKWPKAWDGPETVNQPSMKVPHEEISEHLLDTKTSA